MLLYTFDIVIARSFSLSLSLSRLLAFAHFSLCLLFVLGQAWLPFLQRLIPNLAQFTNYGLEARKMNHPAAMASLSHDQASTADTESCDTVIEWPDMPFNIWEARFETAYADHDQNMPADEMGASALDSLHFIAYLHARRQFRQRATVELFNYAHSLDVEQVIRIFGASKKKKSTVTLSSIPVSLSSTVPATAVVPGSSTAGTTPLSEVDKKTPNNVADLSVLTPVIAVAAAIPHFLMEKDSVGPGVLAADPVSQGDSHDVKVDPALDTPCKKRKASGCFLVSYDVLTRTYAHDSLGEIWIVFCQACYACP